MGEESRKREESVEEEEGPPARGELSQERQEAIDEHKAVLAEKELEIVELRDLIAKLRQQDEDNTRNLEALQRVIKREKEEQAQGGVVIPPLPPSLTTPEHQSVEPTVPLQSPPVKESPSASQLQERAEELAAVTHHRDVLRRSVTECEEKLLKQSERVAHLETALRDLGHDVTSLSLEEQNDRDAFLLARMTQRSKVLGDLAAHYRKGLLALYGNETSYSAAQHASYLKGGDLSSNSWLDDELNHLRTASSAEIDMLESEVIELRKSSSKSRTAYNELKKRFLEVLTGRSMDIMEESKAEGGSRGSTLSEDDPNIRFLRGEIEKQATEMHRLSVTLASERSSTRARFATLVQDLAKALQWQNEYKKMLQQHGHMSTEPKAGSPGSVEDKERDDLSRRLNLMQMQEEGKGSLDQQNLLSLVDKRDIKEQEGRQRLVDELLRNQSSQIKNLKPRSVVTQREPASCKGVEPASFETREKIASNLQRNHTPITLSSQ